MYSSIPIVGNLPETAGSTYTATVASLEDAPSMGCSYNVIGAFREATRNATMMKNCGQLREVATSSGCIAGARVCHSSFIRICGSFVEWCGLHILHIECSFDIMGDFGRRWLLCNLHEILWLRPPCNLTSAGAVREPAGALQSS